MVTKLMLGWSWIAARLIRKGRKTVSTLGGKPLFLPMRPIHSRADRPSSATRFSWALLNYLPFYAGSPLDAAPVPWRIR